MLIVSKKKTNFKNFFLLFTLFEMKSKKKDFFLPVKYYVKSIMTSYGFENQTTL